MRGLSYMKNNFKNNTRRLFLTYALIPIFIAFLLFSIFIVIILDVKVVFETKQAASNLGEKIENIYSEYTGELQSIARSKEVLNTLGNKTNNHLVYETFYQFNNRVDVKSVFHLIDEKNVFLVSTSPRKDEHDQFIIHNIIPELIKDPTEIYVDFQRTEFGNNKSTVLNIGKAVHVEGEVIGYLLFQLLEDDLQEIIFNEKSDIIVITDEFDYVIVTTNRVTSGLMNKFMPTNVTHNTIDIKNRPYYMDKVVLGNDILNIYALNDKRIDPIVLVIGLFFIVILGVFLYLLLIKMSERMSTKTVESIDKLMIAVSKLQSGDMTSYVSIETGDEFEVLAIQYNNMVDSLNELMEKNEALSDVRNTIEMKLLQSKFNPHFLFNVLETLRNMMYVDRKKAQEMIYSLSRILRYSVDDHEQVVLFRNDLNHMLDYLALHKYRFGDRLMYTIDLDEEVKNAYVPKLLLQPIIENAIKYGYAHTMNLSVAICGKIKDNELIFTISDNGGGMKKEKFVRLQNALNESINKNIKDIGIGLISTDRRLKLQYGEVYGLELLNEVDSGFTVYITLPYYTQNKGGK